MFLFFYLFSYLIFFFNFWQAGGKIILAGGKFFFAGGKIILAGGKTILAVNSKDH